MENNTSPAAAQRVHLLDTLRGIAMIYMILFHIGYDLVYMFGADWLAPFFHDQMKISPVFTAAFVFLAGITVRFSRNPAKHGARLLLIAACFTLVTSFVFAGGAIYFGVLHLISCGMLVYSVISKYSDKLPWWLGAAVCAVIFAFTFNTSKGFFGFKGFSLPVPEMLTINNLLYPFGFITPYYVSVDYLPLLPWLFMFLGGVFVGRLVVGRELPKLFYRDICPPITWLGRHSLMIYILHQPIVFGLLYLIYEII